MENHGTHTKAYPKRAWGCEVRPAYGMGTRSVLLFSSVQKRPYSPTRSSPRGSLIRSTPNVGPRNGRPSPRSRCYKRACEAADFFCQNPFFHSLIFLVLRATYTPKSQYYSRVSKQVPKPRRSREVQFPRRSSAREKPGFCEDLPVSPKDTTYTSCSVVRSSYDQVTV